jgi:hypothetical protein
MLSGRRAGTALTTHARFRQRFCTPLTLDLWDAQVAAVKLNHSATGGSFDAGTHSSTQQAPLPARLSCRSSTGR